MCASKGLRDHGATSAQLWRELDFTPASAAQLQAYLRWLGARRARVLHLRLEADAGSLKQVGASPLSAVFTS